MLRIAFGLVLVSFLSTVVAAPNFPDRKALIVNVCPYVEITSFNFTNEDRERSTRFVQRYHWANRTQQPIVAFEIVTLKYDAFDEGIIGSRTVIAGTDSTNWNPLPAGALANDGTLSYGGDTTFTAIAYVRRARLADGTVWKVNEIRLRDELKKIAPNIKEFGVLAPELKKDDPK